MCYVACETLIVSMALSKLFFDSEMIPDIRMALTYVKMLMDLFMLRRTHVTIYRFQALSIDEHDTNTMTKQRIVAYVFETVFLAHIIIDDSYFLNVDNNSITNESVWYYIISFVKMIDQYFLAMIGLLILTMYLYFSERLNLDNYVNETDD